MGFRIGLAAARLVGFGAGLAVAGHRDVDEVRLDRAQRRDQLTRPLVRIFYSITERSHLPVQELDLADVPEPDRIVGREERMVYAWTSSLEKKYG